MFFLFRAPQGRKEGRKDGGLLQLGYDTQTCLSLLSPATSTEQIAVIVGALKDYYPTGLLVFHDPAKGAFLFLPGSSPCYISLQQAVRWVSVFPQSPCMVFTRSTHSDVGHFQHCSGDVFAPKRASCHNTCTNQALGRGGLMSSNPMSGRGLSCVDEHLGSNAGTPALPEPCSDPNCTVCAFVCFDRSPRSLEQRDASEVPLSDQSFSGLCSDPDCRVCARPCHGRGLSVGGDKSAQSTSRTPPPAEPCSDADCEVCAVVCFDRSPRPLVSKALNSQMPAYTGVCLPRHLFLQPCLLTCMNQQRAEAQHPQQALCWTHRLVRIMLGQQLRRVWLWTLLPPVLCPMPARKIPSATSPMRRHVPQQGPCRQRAQGAFAMV